MSCYMSQSLDAICHEGNKYKAVTKTKTEQRLCVFFLQAKYAAYLACFDTSLLGTSSMGEICQRTPSQTTFTALLNTCCHNQQ